MKVWNLLCACGFASSLLNVAASAADAPSVSTGTITVRTKGYPSDKGKALIQLANSEEDYGSDDSGFRGAEVAVAQGEATVVFADVPYGEYAVKVFHDANENRKLDIGMMGPKEAYGFSNNARGRFGPPDYEDVRFTFDREQITIEIEVK